MTNPKKRPPWLLLPLGLLFLAGLSLLLYPLFSARWNQRRSDALIRDYERQFTAPDAESSAAANHARWFDLADAYNATLPGKGVPDAFSKITPEEDRNYLAQLSFSADGVMGFISIPRISVSLPIYHTTSEAVLQKGVGHLQGSALPVGGESTHCVLSAHRGLPSAALFTDLNLLGPGDHFYLHVLDRVLAYEVDQVLEVEPSDTANLDVIPGADLVTLVTCTPYGVNTHRLLVRGHRVEYTVETVQTERETAVSSVHTRYELWVAAGLGFTALLALILWRVSRRGGKRLEKKGRRH